MEDKRRRVDSDKKESPSIKGASLNPKRITIMVMRSVGKIRSYKISRHLLFWAFMFIIAYTIASLYIINKYFDLRYLHNVQSEELKLLTADNEQKDKSLIQTKQHIAILEDYIDNIQVQEDPELVQQETVQTKTEIISRIKQEAYEDTEGAEKSSIAAKIGDFIARQEESQMSVDFKLVNALPQETAMEGYIHIIASDRQGNLFSEWKYTDSMMKDGYPINYRKGQPFLIQRFKQYKRIFLFNPNSELPSAIRILVYDRGGKQILENEFKVDNVS